MVSQREATFPSPKQQCKKCNMRNHCMRWNQRVVHGLQIEMNLIWDQKQNQEQPLLVHMAGKTLTHSVYANLPSIVREWKRQSENGFVDQQNIGSDPSNKHSPSPETPQKGVWWHRESKDRSHHRESEAISRLNRGWSDWGKRQLCCS
jgi:hypothetical protein